MWPLGGKYEGEFDGSQHHGKGTETWKDESIYIGDWENDKMDGSGL
jgi:hypothetical protein